MTKFNLHTDQENAKALKDFNEKVPAIRELFDRTVGSRALTLEDLAQKYNVGELKFDSLKVAAKVVDGYCDGDAEVTVSLKERGFFEAAAKVQEQASALQEDPMTARLFDAYHELEDAYEKIHLLELKLSQIHQVLTCDIPAQASVIAALSILNDVEGLQSATVEEVSPHTKRSV
jgi:hypothetical protein